jgi:hypothetical protein
MSTPQRKKGTRFETVLLKWLRAIWPTAVRAGTTLGLNDKGDYLNLNGWLVEAKHHKVPHVMPWVRVLREKAHGMPWLLAVRTDARTEKDIAVMDLQVALGLIALQEGERP